MAIPNVPGILAGAGESVNFEQAMVPAALFRTGFEYAVYSGAVNPTIKEMYSILLVDITKGFAGDAIEVIEGIDPHNAGESTVANDKAEHFFSVPPKVINVNEPFATKIVPTQGGGKYVESHGVLIREVQVQGNSGLRPNKPLPAAVDLLSGLGPASGIANSLAGPLINRADRLGDIATDPLGAFNGGRRLKPEERTGYDDVMKLRNIFRAYADIKQNRAKASKVVMLWRNVKDADYWVVEPKEFKLVQDSKSPMTYNYQIALKTLSRFEYTPHFSEDKLAAIRSTNNLISSVQGATRELTTTLLVVSTQIDRLAGLGIFAQNLIMNPLINTIRGTAAIVGSSQGFTPSFVNNWQRLNDSLQEASDALDARIHTNVSTTTVTASVAPLTTEEQELVDSLAPVQNAIRAAQRAARRVLTLPGVRASMAATVSARRDRAVASFSRPVVGSGRLGVTPATAGDPSFLGNDTFGGKLARACVNNGETIQSLAQRLLGNRSRWKLLAMINDLRAPYISTSGEPHTAAPGDCILYPTEDGTGIGTEDLNPDDLEKDQRGQNPDTAIERAYGRDIRLKSDNFNRTDFALSVDGDIASIQGVPNVRQALRLKFSTQQGTLTVHPKYGAAFPIGSKMTPISFNLFRLNAFATMVSDERVIAVKRMDFVARGDILSIGAELILKDTADTTTTAFKVRSL